MVAGEGWWRVGGVGSGTVLSHQYNTAKGVCSFVHTTTMENAWLTHACGAMTTTTPVHREKKKKKKNVA